MSKVKTCCIADFCKTGSGSTPSRNQIERYYEGGNIPWVKSGELREGLITETEEHVTEAALKETSVKLVPKGAILLAMYGATVGRLAILDVEATTNQAVCHIVPDPKMAETRYLYHAIASQVPQIISMGVGGAQPNINQGIIKELKILLPPLPEQRRIAAILDQADALRAKRREALAELDKLAQSIFVEMFGDPIENSKKWPTKRLGEIVRVRRGGSPRPIDQFLGGTVNWIKIGDATKGDDIYISKCAEKITEAGLRKTVFLKAGSLIFANCGVSLGFARILKIDGCIHDGWLSFDEINEDLLNKLFLLKALNTVTTRFRSMAPDGTQPNLNTEIMKNFQMILPPISLQNEFSRILSTFQLLKASQEASISELGTLFASIQHRAFQGEL